MDLSTAKFSPYLRATVAAFLVPNIPFWIACAMLAPMGRAVFNMDFVLAVSLFLLSYRRTAIIVLISGILFDTLNIVEDIYRFSQHDLAYAASFIFRAPLSATLAASAIVISIGFVIVVVLLRLVPKETNRSIAVALLLAVPALKVVDTFNGFNGYIPLRESTSGVRLINESAVRFTRGWVHSLRKGRAPLPMFSATAPLFAALQPLRSVKSDARLSRNIVLIVVESLGARSDGRSSFTMFAVPPILDSYSVESGLVPFDGATVPGEMRELCGFHSDVWITDSQLNLKSQCLPILLAKRGYETEALHGFQGAMFGRDQWYPALGFQRSAFLEDLQSRSGFNHCYAAFNGICDHDIAVYLRKRLSDREHKHFIHWMTLDSHLPIPRMSGARSECEHSADEDVCYLDATLNQTLSSIAQLAADPTIGPTEFIIVGDHAPPFAVRRRRELYSQLSVPYIRLTPKETKEPAHYAHLSVHRVANN